MRKNKLIIFFISVMDLVELDNMMLSYDDRKPDLDQLTKIIQMAKQLGSIKHLKAAYTELYNEYKRRDLCAEEVLKRAVSEGVFAQGECP